MMPRSWKVAVVTAMTGILTAGAIMVGPTTAVQAAEIPDIYCELVGEGWPNFGYRFEVRGTAYYTDNLATGKRRWTQFSYRLTLIRETHGTKNNVNIRLSEGGDRVWSWNSPDDRRIAQTYHLVLGTPVYTRISGPANDLIEIEGIMDRADAPDPRCTAWAKK